MIVVTLIALFNKKLDCASLMSKYALDLINHQKAKIERLEQNINGLETVTKNHIKVIRMQAIKKFAELVKSNKNKLFNSIYSNAAFDENIDNFVEKLIVSNEI